MTTIDSICRLFPLRILFPGWIACLFIASPGWAEAEPEEAPKNGFLIFRFLDRIETPEHWEGALNLGFSMQRGEVSRSERRFETRLRVQKKFADYRYQLAYLYGRQNGQLSADRLTAAFRYRRNFEGPRFIQATSNYETDRVRGTNHEVRQTIGYGLALINSERVKLDIVPGLAGTFIERSQGDADPWKVLFNLDQNLNWQIAEDLQFVQNTDVLYEPTNEDNYRIQFQARVETRLIGKLTIALRYDWDYNTFVNPGIRRLTERFFTTLGYQF